MMLLDLFYILSNFFFLVLRIENLSASVKSLSAKCDLQVHQLREKDVTIQVYKKRRMVLTRETYLVYRFFKMN